MQLRVRLSWEKDPTNGTHMQSLTQRALIPFACLMAITYLSLSNSTGKGNPKQHITHFIETYSNDGIEEDRLLGQFV